MIKIPRNVYQKRISKKDQLIGILVGMEIEKPGSVAELTTDELQEVCLMCSVEGTVEYKDGKLVQAGMKYCDTKTEFNGGTEPRAGQFYRSNIKSRLTGGKSTKLPTPILDFAF